MRPGTLAAGIGIALTALGTLAVSSRTTVHATGPFTVAPGVALPDAAGGVEPRYTVTPDGKHYAISNQVCPTCVEFGNALVWESDDGLTNWHATNTTGIANQSLPSTDVDIVAMPAGSVHAGRLIAVELDFQGINFRISYSDDGGVNWTSSGTGTPPITLNAAPGGELGDQDRPWLATGPGDTAYLLFHNLASGTANHNMYVSTSTDDGANFGAPIPVTQPLSQANVDLQCADSGGPSNIFTNPRDGRVFVVWGTRSSQVGGGCAASITGQFEVNVVAATRVWVATAPAPTGLGTGTEDPTQWQQSLAVDDFLSGQIVGMQLAPGAIDSADNLYILYPESISAYPDYDGAAIKYVHATQADILSHPYGTGLPSPPANVWSTPVTVAASGAAGHLLPHLVAGGPGEIDMAYFEGVESAPPSTTADWYLIAAQSLDALDAHPAIAYQKVDYPGTPPAPAAAFSGWTASQMMGACGTGPAAGVENGTICSRSTDVWGIALDTQGRLQITWPSANPGDFRCGGTAGSLPCSTWVSTQIDGPTIAPGQPGNGVPEAPITPAIIAIGAAVAAAGGLGVRRRHSARTT